MAQRWKILMFSFALAATPLVGSVRASAQETREYVHAGPPAARREKARPRPGKDYVFIKGHWGYSGGKYEWAPGRWDRPEANHRRWNDGHWAHDRHGYYWVEGSWH